MIWPRGNPNGGVFNYTERERTNMVRRGRVRESSEVKAGEEGWYRTPLGFLFLGTFTFLLWLERGGAGAVFAAAVSAAGGEGGKEGFGFASIITSSATGSAKDSSALTGGKGVFGVASETCSASGLEAALPAALAPVRVCSRLARRRRREGVGLLGRC